MALPTGTVLATSDEERAIRDAVGGIAGSFGSLGVGLATERIWLFW